MTCLALPSCEKKAEAPGGPAAGTHTRSKPARRDSRQNHAESLDSLRTGLKLQENAKKRAEYFEKNSASLLGKLSPEELKDLISSLDYNDDGADRFLANMAFKELAGKDAKLALDMAKGMKPDDCQQVGLNIFAILSEKQPEELVSWIRGNDWTDPNSRWLSVFASDDLARHRPEEAVEMLRTADPARMARLSYPILIAVAKTDPARAAQVAKGLPLGEAGRDVRVAVYTSFGGVDPARAFAEVTALNDPYIANRALAPIVGDWIKKDPKAVLDQMGTLPVAAVQSVLGRSENLSTLIDSDPAKVTAVLDRLVFTEANAGIFQQAARLLVTKDAAMTTQWLESFPDSPKKGALFREVTMARLSQNPGENAPLILAEQGPYRDIKIQSVGEVIGKTDPVKALGFATQLSAAEQPAFVATALRASLGGDLNPALGIISGKDVSPEVQASRVYRDAVRATADTYAGKDIQAAVKWASSLEGETSVAAVSGVASRWAREDPNATAEWIHQLPTGEPRNSAIRGLLSQIEATDPEAAKKWKEEIR